MKVSKLFLGLSLCGVILSAGALSASAVDNGPDGIGTTGKIDFEAGSGKGDIIKPETDPDEIIETDDGNYTEGPLRIQFVPNFDFGTQKILSGTKNYNPKYIKYNTKGDATDKYMQQFAQVTDETGTDDGFILTVKSSAFKRATAGDELENSYITLLDGKLSNTVKSNTEIATLVDTFKGATGTETLKMTSNAATVMATKPGKDTNGTQTSLVFDKDYNEAILGNVDSLNKGVTFTKVKEDSAKITANDPYVSTVTWTLTKGK